METQLVEAFNGVGDNATKAGERVVNRPTSINEAVETYSGPVVLKGFWKSYVIAIQAEIRRGTTGKGRKTLTKNEQMFASLPEDKQAELLALTEDNKS